MAVVGGWRSAASASVADARDVRSYAPDGYSVSVVLSHGDRILVVLNPNPLMLLCCWAGRVA